MVATSLQRGIDVAAANSNLRAQRLALAGLAINLFLAVAKLIGGVVGHSYALVADAIESIGDIVGSVVIWGGLHISSRPATHKHPYGFGKAESLAALAVSVLVFIAGIGIAFHAVHAILTPHPPPEWWTLIILGAVMVVKEALYRTVSRAGRESDSDAVMTDAWHHRADAITSLAAFIGIAAALWYQYPPADDYAALVAAVVILYNSGKLIVGPIRELLDAEPTSLVESVRSVASGVPGVNAVEMVHARKSGTRYWIDMHLWVDPQMTVFAAHAVSHRVKDAVRAAHPLVHEVMIHIEPTGDPDSDEIR